MLHARLLNDWTSRSETSAHWRDNRGKKLRGDVAAWWPSGKPQQQPEQCGQLPPQNEMLLSGQMCRVINSFDLCKLPQLHRSAKGWNVYSAQNTFRPAWLFPCRQSPAWHRARLPLHRSAFHLARFCVRKLYASNVTCLVAVSQLMG